MKVALVTLNVTAPSIPELVATRELTFSPATISGETLRAVSADTLSVGDLRWLPGVEVKGTIVDISPSGTRSDAVAFHFTCDLPEVVPSPEQPLVGCIVADEVADQATPEASAVDAVVAATV